MSLPASREHVEPTRVNDKAVTAAPLERALGGDQFRPENLRLFNQTVRMAGDAALPAGFPSAEVAGPKTHTVASGDSLWSIASKNLSQDGTHKPTGQEINSYIHQIAKHNSISNPHKIRDGSKLELPEYKADGERSPGGEPAKRRGARGAEERPSTEEPSTRRGARTGNESGEPRRAGQDRPAERAPAERPATERPTGERPKTSRSGHVEGQEIQGVMSHYGLGDGFHGKRMADGRIFNREGFTVAHNHLPKGSMVDITGPNGKTVRAEVTDRGGFEKYGRQMDVSYGIAKALGFVEQGVTDFVAKVVSIGDNHYYSPKRSGRQAHR
jgi:rare lipoprotein A (peptidoglycan hydrolase)